MLIENSLNLWLAAKNFKMFNFSFSNSQWFLGRFKEIEDNFVSQDALGDTINTMMFCNLMPYPMMHHKLIYLL